MIMIMITVGVTANGDPAAPPATEGAGGPGAGRRVRAAAARAFPASQVPRGEIFKLSLFEAAPSPRWRRRGHCTPPGRRDFRQENR